MLAGVAIAGVDGDLAVGDDEQRRTGIVLADQDGAVRKIADGRPLRQSVEFGRPEHIGEKGIGGEDIAWLHGRPP